MILKKIDKKDRFRQWIPHLLGLLTIIALPLIISDSSDAHLLRWQEHFSFQFGLLALTFYINYLFIFPKFHRKDNTKTYVIVVTIFAIVMILSMQIIFFVFLKEKVPLEIKELLTEEGGLGKRWIPRAVENLFFVSLTLGFSFSLAMLKRNSKEQKEQEQREKVHKEIELNFLRNQISPHFFFNALNNIYALIAIDSDRAQSSVEKLSELMRYLIYDSNIQEVQLQKEFDFAKNYIDLMQQRLSSKVKLNIDIESTVPQATIPPLLFIPFIENSFKHGISYREESWISISLKMVDNRVHFLCQNSIPKSKEASINREGGLGIENSRKRLDIIYGDDADIVMTDTDNIFTVKLDIPIKSIGDDK